MTVTADRTSLAPPSPGSRPLAAAALVAVVVGQVLSFLLTAIAPGGDPSEGISYDKVADDPDVFWALFAYGGVGIALFCGGLAVAVCALVRERGALLARIGAVFAVVAGVFMSAGLAAIGVVYSYAADPSALKETTGRALVEHLNDHDGRVMALMGPGLLALALVTVLFAAALWRSRAVPRRLTVLFLVGGVLGFVFPSGAAGAVAAVPGTIAAILIAWHAWRPAAD